MKLIDWIIGKVMDFADPLLSFFGRGTRAEQILLESLVHSVLNAATPEATAFAINELQQFLSRARLNKLNFTSSVGSSSLLIQMINAAEKNPALWECLKEISKRKFHASLGWNKSVPGKDNESTGPSPLGILVALAFEGEGDVEVTFRGAQELLLALVNEGVPLDWNAHVREGENTTALWVLTAAANNGQAWAVAMLHLVIKQANENLDWNAISEIENEQDTALALVTQLAFMGSPQYLQAVLQDETVFSRLNFNVKIDQTFLIDKLAGKQESMYLATWILLAGRDIKEDALSGSGKTLAEKLNKRTREVAEKLWCFEQVGIAGKAKQDSEDTIARLSSDFIQSELEEELKGIPVVCQKWVIGLAKLHNKFVHRANEVEVVTFGAVRTAIEDLITGNRIPAVLNAFQRRQIADAVKTMPLKDLHPPGVAAKIRALDF